MSILKRTILAPFAVIALAASVQAFADPIRHTIQLTAYVPESDFYVNPTDPGWINLPQALSWDMVASELRGINKSFDTKNTAGAINGYINSPGLITDGTEVINLEIKFNGVTLSTTSTQVLTEAEAKTHKAVNLQINPVKPAGGYVPGNYDGNISLIFDAA